MKVGVCVSHQDAMKVPPDVDFIEENVQRYCVPLTSDAAFEEQLIASRSCGFAIPIANSFLPGTIRSVGPELDIDAVRSYANTSFIRASRGGIRMIVFGSGASRAIPDGTTRPQALSDFLSVLEAIAPIALTHGIMIVIEPLNRGECNFINSLAEGAEIVERCNQPNIRLLADIYHMLREDEAPDELRRFCRLIHHVHIAERDNRTVPGAMGDDFRPYLTALKQGAYAGDMAIECKWRDLESDIRIGMSEVRRQLSESGF